MEDFTKYELNWMRVVRRYSTLWVVYLYRLSRIAAVTNEDTLQV